MTVATTGHTRTFFIEGAPSNMLTANYWSMSGLRLLLPDYVDRDLHSRNRSMVVNRAEDASRLDGHHTHSKFAPCHALDLRAKVNRSK
jgi:hypothetical protein